MATVSLPLSQTIPLHHHCAKPASPKHQLPRLLGDEVGEAAVTPLVL